MVATGREVGSVGRVRFWGTSSETSGTSPTTVLLTRVSKWVEVQVVQVEVHRRVGYTGEWGTQACGAREVWREDTEVLRK